MRSRVIGRRTTTAGSGTELTQEQKNNIAKIPLLIANEGHTLHKVAGFSNTNHGSIGAYTTAETQQVGARAVVVGGMPIIYDWNTNQVIVGGSSGVGAGVGTEASVQTADNTLQRIRFNGAEWQDVIIGAGGGGDDFLPSPELSYDDYTSALYNLHVKADGSWVAVRRDVSTLTGTRVEGIAGTKPTTSEQLIALFNN